MALTFSCTCGASITVPDVLAGHEGRCPSCDQRLRAPALRREPDALPSAPAPAPAPPSGSGTDAPPDGVRVVTAVPRGVLAPATKARLILEFPCPGCGEVLRVGVTNAGRAGRCTLCGTTFDVPTPREPTEAPTPPAPDTPSTRRTPSTPSAPSAPARSARDAFKVVRVTCGCGRQVATPLARLEQGQARCPTCDRPLAS